MEFSHHQQFLGLILTSFFNLFPILTNLFVSSLSQQLVCHDHEKLALLQFKQSFYIVCAFDHDHPVSSYPKVKQWGSYETDDREDCCTWDGVKCDKKTGYVIELDLSSSCLYGTFPPNSTLFSLIHLKKLNLAYNEFNFSQIPDSIGRLNQLTSLNLSQSALSGQIPSQFSELSKLTRLDLSRNGDKLVSTHLDLKLYNPSLHTLVRNMTRTLDLTATALSGELPHSIGNLGFLNSLRIRDCQFSGNIPASIGNLTRLIRLSLSGNNFDGDIPSSLTNLTQLRVFGISSLKVRTGDLRSWLPKFNKLTALGLGSVSGLHYVNQNDLSFIANFTKLVYLNLTANQLTGEVPHWLINMTQLTWFYVGENQLQGPIPQWFSHLTSLRSLSLSHNNLSCDFEIFLKMKNLRSLDLSNTRITFPSNTSINSSFLSKQFDILNLGSCNLTDFPQFLRKQDNLQFLSLSGNNINSTIPKWFMNISRGSLLLLDLSENLLTSFEHSQLVLPWTSLKFLDLTGNRLKGILPYPSKTTEIYLISHNLLTGFIPQQVCFLSALTFLDLSDNNLSGEIPSCIAKLLSTSLVALNLRGNNFHGTIPASFTRSCKLKMINLSENELNGELPRSLANCEMLELLDVSNNRVKDIFPYWLKSLSKLQILVLRHNYFHGHIPSSVSNDDFRSLHVLDLSYNLHTGRLPFDYLQNLQAKRSSNPYEWDSSSIIIPSSLLVFDMTYYENQIYNYAITITVKGSERFYSRILNVFQFVDFSSNNFTGHIPDFIGDLTEVRAINLSSNNLDGGIPASLAHISVLESLDLSLNMLSGDIPQELAELTSLAVFNVAYNHLTGPIPQGKQFDTFETSSYLGNLGFCGSPLSKKCGKSSLFPPLPSKRDQVSEEETPFINWVVRFLGCLSGLIVGFVGGKYYITDRYHDWFMKTFATKRWRTLRRMS
ncbi:hypothetical protein BVRB_9g225680 [Beta vulgaris subsp. vulgaris]|uniref:Disease resistance R13L4/SHOC-2-like LRR domain-containing protein n=1 Tax=Beta vulgaris subsp. vulgaris TaxID=3555 RepID=A0A0J8B960_BETVV|nr:hypothetical protein BVRB_9g225680 [Beta vulgaris subsp. vulgaris]